MKRNDQSSRVGFGDLERLSDIAGFLQQRQSGHVAERTAIKRVLGILKDYSSIDLFVGLPAFGLERLAVTEAEGGTMLIAPKALTFARVETLAAKYFNPDETEPALRRPGSGVVTRSLWLDRLHWELVERWSTRVVGFGLAKETLVRAEDALKHFGYGVVVNGSIDSPGRSPEIEQRLQELGPWPRLGKRTKWTNAEREHLFMLRHWCRLGAGELEKLTGLSRQAIDKKIGSAMLKSGGDTFIDLGWHPSDEVLDKCSIKTEVRPPAQASKGHLKAA